MPRGGDLVEAAPDADREPRQCGRAERRHLAVAGHLDRHPQDVGLELHEPRVPGRAAVGPKRRHRQIHGHDDVGGLEGDRLERGAGDLGPPRAARQARDQTARVGVPVGRAEPGEGGDEVDAAGRLDRAGQSLGLGRIGDQAEAVAQPLHGGAGDEDGALERRHARLRRRGAEDAVRWRPALLALVGQDEAARAVGRLGLAGPEAGLAEERRLLVARQTGERHARSADLGLADHTARRHDPRQHVARDTEESEQLAVPPDRIEPGQHGARRVGRVGDVHRAARQVPGEPALDRAEENVALDAGEQPLQLGGREVRVGHEAGALADQVGRELSAALRRPPVLPHDRRVERASVAAPHDGRLALVRDPDPGEVGRADPGVAQRIGGRLVDGAEDLVRVMLDPAGPRVGLAHLAMPAPGDPEPLVGDEAGRPGRALVDGEDHDAGAAAGIAPRWDERRIQAAMTRQKPTSRP